MKNYIFLTIILLSFSFLSADVSVGNSSHSIQDTYGPSQNIKGWINISLEEVNANATVSDSFGNNLSLYQFLNLSKSTGYTCNPRDCLTAFQGLNPSGLKSFDLNGRKVLGIKINDRINNINSFKFGVTSDIGPACSNQVNIDVLDDGTQDFFNNKSSDLLCSQNKDYGCYSQDNDRNFILQSNPSCQKFSFVQSPGISVGAWIKKSTNGNGVKIDIYSKSGENLKGCTISDSQIAPSGSEVGCNLDLITRNEDYYICISDQSNSQKYEILGHSLTNGCGFNGIPPKTGSSAYKIYYQRKAFDFLGNVNISLSGGPLTDYITNKYGQNCTSGCILPISFQGLRQNITISNIDLGYTLYDGGLLRENQIYDLSESVPKVNSNYIKINLDSLNFKVPEEKKVNYTYKLLIGDKEIFETKISVSNATQIKNIYPTKVPAGLLTEFYTGVESNSNITEYSWDFGNGNSKKTIKPFAESSYNKTGNFTIKISVKDSAGNTVSSEFDIDVISPKEAINSTIINLKQNVANVKSNLTKFNSFEKTAIEKNLNLSIIEREIDSFEREYISATSESSYIGIMSKLSQLRVPKYLSISEQANSLAFYPSEDLIDAEVVSEIAGGEVELNIEKGIQSWNSRYIDNKLSFKEISGIYNKGTDTIVRIFSFNIKKNEDLNYDEYVFLKKLNGIEFDNSAGWLSEGEYYYKRFTEDMSFSISTTQEIDFSNLPLFISPSLINIESTDTGYGEPEPKPFKIFWFIFIILLLIFIALVIYVLLQEWYRIKYETYLFKDRNYLFNISAYISESAKNKMMEDEIANNLKKAGWNGEQVTYALNKYYGRRTGMIELIPIEKIKKMFKKEDNLNKPQVNFRGPIQKINKQ